ncbi:MAG: hypothetical protein ABFD89_17525 [Bryobacteraceae bacterium]
MTTCRDCLFYTERSPVHGLCRVHRLQYTAKSEACEYLIVPSGLRWSYDEDHDDPNDVLFSWELLRDGFEVGQLWSKDRIHWKAFSDETNNNIASGTVDHCARVLVAKVRAQ